MAAHVETPQPVAEMIKSVVAMAPIIGENVEPIVEMVELFMPDICAWIGKDVEADEGTSLSYLSYSGILFSIPKHVQRTVANKASLFGTCLDSGFTDLRMFKL